MVQNSRIALTGGGRQFPKNISHCPVKKSTSVFKTRSEAIAHVKNPLNSERELRPRRSKEQASIILTEVRANPSNISITFRI